MISDDEVVSIGKTLQANTTLQTLDISNNNKVTSDGIHAFGDCLRKGINLQLLRISLNDHNYNF